MPSDWKLKLIDMNVQKLKKRHFKDIDIVFISAMSIQSKSVRNIIDQCKSLKIKIAAGGPLFSTEYEKYDDVDYLILNEAEINFPRFLKDLKNGQPEHIYASNDYCSLSNTPIPSWGLINMKKYKSMSIQYTRGCPYNCDFCNVTALFGHKVRSKTKDQVRAELESLYDHKWRSGVFFVDDNFIGNKKKLKKDFLPNLIEWMEKKKYPFVFNTQASVNLAEDLDLMALMVKSGFDSVFVGIETPNEDSLAECKKFQNTTRDLISSIKAIHNAGLQVMGGFIVGFDSDPASIFQRQIDFIQNSRIVTAMVGLLNAPKGTILYQRLASSNRLHKDFTGDNTDFSMNFIPKLDYNTLLQGYQNILKGIYSPKQYYERVKGFMRDYNPGTNIKFKRALIRNYIESFRAFLRSILILGILDKARLYYWKFVIWAFLKKRKLFPLAITFAIYGFHFRKVFNLNKLD